MILALVITGTGCSDGPRIGEGARLRDAGRVAAVAFSPDGKFLAAGTEKAGEYEGEYWSGTLRLWSTDSWQQTAAHTVDQWVNALAFSPDGKLLAASCGTYDDGVKNHGRYRFRPGFVRLWDSTGQREVGNLGDTGLVFALAFSADGKTLAAGGGRKDQAGTVTLWDPGSRAERLRLRVDDGIVRAITFLPGGKTFATGSQGSSVEMGAVRIWDVATGRQVSTLQAAIGGVLQLALSPDGKTLAAVSSYGEIKLWEVGGWKERSLPGLVGGFGSYTRVAFSPDSKRLAVTSSASSNDGSFARAGYGPIIVWNLDTGSRLVSERKRREIFLSAAFSRDGGTLATGMFEGAVQLWSVP